MHKKIRCREKSQQADSCSDVTSLWHCGVMMAFCETNSYQWVQPKVGLPIIKVSRCIPQIHESPYSITKLTLNEPAISFPLRLAQNPLFSILLPNCSKHFFQMQGMCTYQSEEVESPKVSCDSYRKEQVEDCWFHTTRIQMGKYQFELKRYP